MNCQLQARRGHCTKPQQASRTRNAEGVPSAMSHVQEGAFLFFWNLVRSVNVEESGVFVLATDFLRTHKIDL